MAFAAANEAAEPVANHSYVADFAHQQVVFGGAFSNNLHTDTGQEPVADYAYVADPAHQHVVLEKTLNDNLFETNPGYGYEFGPGNGYGFIAGNYLEAARRMVDSRPVLGRASPS